MSDPAGAWTRRQFLEMVGKAGGAAAVYETMVALGLMRVPEALAAPPPDLPAGSLRGVRVLVLGAGVGGLTAAWRLAKAEADVTVLEAANRIGGRSYTVRQGDKIQQMGRSDQECRFTDKDLYFNAGPGRIPYHHTTVIDVCKELGVPLEVYIMETRANLFQTDQAFGGKAEINRRIANDTRGYISELLAKSVFRGALDSELTREDRERLIDLLLTFGKIRCEDQYVYKGSSRSGYKVPPAVVEPGKIVESLPLQQLLKSQFWKYRFYQPEDYEWQATLFQPVGGMDQIAQKLAAAIRKIKPDAIQLNAQVVHVRQSDQPGQEIEVDWRAAGSADLQKATAQYCISNIPVPLLRRAIDNDSFEEEFIRAVGAVPFAPACKVGWQADGRFWETRNQIYGGISWTDDMITQLWYPSAGFFTPTGILTGLYNYGENAVRFGRQSLSERLQTAAAGARKLHPEFDDHVDIHLGLSIAWQEVPHLEGGWAEWTDNPENRRAYRRLLAPDKRFWVCGDQVSYLPGWQEGAMLSANHVLRQLQRSVRRQSIDLGLPLEIAAPEAAFITGAEAP
ncbi:MAG TPA: FAD-dependent oxidoreductase [Thermoanaerobaculia bacterium]|nr:FAD-dependent oxidoreductase [Thermoanaerobaculia bacterium]